MSNPEYVHTWEEELEKRVRKEIQGADQRQQDNGLGRPCMIGICGIPGSGKSTSTQILADRLKDVGACTVPMDGYHLPRSALAKFPDPADALYRRGAPDTFDPAAMIRDLTEICAGTSLDVYLPGFDHSVGDPMERRHHFQRNKHRVVICEGLYLLHASDGWGGVKDLFDFVVYVEADIDKCMERLKIRNKVIPGYTVEEIEIRVDAVDRANAILVGKSKNRADLVVQSAASSLQHGTETTGVSSGSG